jgi:iron(III) transport system substrate-binding protein
VRTAPRHPLAIAVIAMAVLLSACGGTAPGGTASDTTLVLYNAQHAGVGKAWAEAFTAKTGIPVDVRNGSDFDLANQIVAEGAGSPADVFITENSPAMSLVSDKGLFAPVDPATRAQVPAQYSSSKGDWVGVAARSTVFIYNSAALTEQQLPNSIMDLAKPEWKDKFGVSPAGADFQAIVSAVYLTQGDAAGAAWLQGIKDNARVYRGNIPIMKAANAGEIPAGVIYHYYWYGDQADGGANSSATKLRFFGNQDPGAFLSVSGGGVLSSSRHPQAAQQLLAFMTGRDGQQILSDGTALEYSVGSGVAPNPKLKPLAELQAPAVDPSGLNGPKVIAEMQRVGLL